MHLLPRSYRKMASRACGFTLLEIMTVVTIVIILSAIAIPSWQRARKRSQATLVKQELRLIDDAINQYALDRKKISGATLVFDDLKDYLDVHGNLRATGADLFGNSYGPTFTVSILPNPPTATYQALSDVVGSDYWAPFTPITP